jgi:hypothetical protein
MRMNAIMLSGLANSGKAITQNELYDEVRENKGSIICPTPQSEKNPKDFECAIVRWNYFPYLNNVIQLS